MDNKLLRSVLAFALAGSALLATGCNKEKAAETAPAATAQTQTQAVKQAPLAENADAASKAAYALVGKSHVVIGVDEEFPPIVFRDGDGKLIGHDIDMAKEAFKRMGVAMEHRAVFWGGKDEELLRKKTIDMLWSGVNISEERKQIYQFSDPYLDNDQVAVVLTGSHMQGIPDFGGKTVGVQAGSSLIPRLKEFQGPGGGVRKIETYPEYAQILVALMEGKVDVAVMGDVALPSYMQNAPGTFRVLPGKFSTTSMGIAMRKGEPELTRRMNEVLAAMNADGTTQKIHDRWFPGRKTN